MIYEDRKKRLLAAMADAGIDVLLIYGNAWQGDYLRYTTDYAAERMMRDAKITQIWEGTNQVHRQLIGRSFAAK